MWAAVAAVGHVGLSTVNTSPITLSPPKTRSPITPYTPKFTRISPLNHPYSSWDAGAVPDSSLAAILAPHRFRALPERALAHAAPEEMPGDLLRR